MLSSSGQPPGATQSLTERIAAYLPAIALPDPARLPATTDGAIVRVEVEGFSALAESLVKTGREGADVLVRVLNSYFGPLNQMVLQHGGQALHYDGLGMLAFLPLRAGESMAEVLKRAGGLGLSLLKLNQSFHSVQTPDGRYSFQMRAGAGAGSLSFLVLGADVLGRALVFNGPAIEDARRACEQAQWNAALVWNDSGVEPAQAVETGPLVAPTYLSDIFEDELPLSVFNRLSPYIPRALAQRLKSAPDTPIGGEFRRVVNIFVHLAGLDLAKPEDVAALGEYYLTVQRVCAGLDGRVHQIVPLPNEPAVRLHLTFGALLSNSEDADHALRAALTVRDLPTPSGRLPTLGVASGNVFTGSIGNAHRQKYIVLGDVVNLSARFAEAASVEGAGTLLVDRYTRERVGLGFLFGEDIILNLQNWPFPVRASRLLAPRPQAYSLTTFVRDQAPTGSLPTGSLGTLDEVLGGQRRVLILREAGQASHMAQRWIKRGGKGASGVCTANGVDVPYLAWTGLLGGLIGLNDSDSRTEKAAKLSQAVARYAPDYTPLTGWLNQLIGLAPEEPGFRQRMAGPQRGQFCKMVVDLLNGMANTNPLLLIFKDLQWSDGPGLVLLEQVIRDLNGTPILFCLTAQRGNPDLDARLAALPGLVV
jgi:class 3 adenylate cyclase